MYSRGRLGVLCLSILGLGGGMHFDAQVVCSHINICSGRQIKGHRVCVLCTNMGRAVGPWTTNVLSLKITLPFTDHDQVNALSFMYEAQLVTKTDPKPSNPLGLDVTICISLVFHICLCPGMSTKWVGTRCGWVGGDPIIGGGALYAADPCRVAQFWGIFTRSLPDQIYRILIRHFDEAKKL